MGAQDRSLVAHWLTVPGDHGSKLGGGGAQNFSSLVFDWRYNSSCLAFNEIE